MTTEETTNSSLWKVDERESTDAVLVLRCPEGWWKAFVRWDGCVNLYSAGNVPYCKEYGDAGEMRDDAEADCYIHFCDIDDAILRLIELRNKAKSKWPHWPDI